MTEFQRRFQRRPIPLTIGGCISVSRIVLHLGKDKSITRLFRKIRPYHTSSQLAFEHQAGLFQHAHRGKVLRVARGPYSVDSRKTQRPRRDCPGRFGCISPPPALSVQSVSEVRCVASHSASNGSLPLARQA